MKTRRRAIQFGFLALTIYGVFVYQGNAERWCPFGGVEALYGYATEGNMLCSLGVSNFYILGAVLLLAVLMRRVFCGYMCPIGALSEWLGAGAKRCGMKPLRVSPAVDRVLSLFKYAVLAIILYITWRASELLFRAFDPCYALIGRHGEDITFWAYVVAGAIIVGSLLVTMPFCRWFCPLAVIFQPFSKLGLTRIKRDETTCIDCGKCARACPMAIPVDKLKEVTVARCMSCMDCIPVCPTSDAGTIGWGPPKRLGRHWPQGVLIAALFLIVGGAVAAVYAFPMPSFVRERGDRPALTATVALKIDGLKCRGSATALTERFLWRDDLYAVSGYLKIEAWPGPGFADAKVTYDPAQTSENAIKQALTEAFLDEEQVWPSPFEIEGYDPLEVVVETLSTLTSGPE